MPRKRKKLEKIRRLSKIKWRHRRAVMLVGKNLAFAYSFANKAWRLHSEEFRRLEIRYDDLVQEMLLELYRAALAFNPSMGFKFTTLAGTYFRSMVNNLVTAAKTGKRKETPLSFSTPGMGVEKIAAKKPRVRDKETRDELLRAIRGLPFSERDKRIVVERFGLLSGSPKTLEQAAKKHGMTKQNVSLIEAKFLKKLRENPKLRHHIE